MKKVYLDKSRENKCISVFLKDVEVVLAGTTVNVMSVKHKNEEYQKFAEVYDVHFIFEDNVPKMDFYTIPMVDIFTVDSVGGYIGSLGQVTDLEADVPICYIDAQKKSYVIASNGKEWLDNIRKWREKLTPYDSIEFYESIEDTQEKYEFIDTNELEELLPYRIVK